MFGLQLVPSNAFPTSLRVRRVQTQAMLAGDKRERLFKVAAELVRRASFSRIIAGDSESSAKGAVRILEAADVVTLPAMKRNGNARKLSERFADIYTEFGVAFFCEVERAFEMLGRLGHNRIRGRTLGRARIGCQGSRS